MRAEQTRATVSKRLAARRKARSPSLDERSVHRSNAWTAMRATTSFGSNSPSLVLAAAAPSSAVRARSVASCCARAISLSCLLGEFNSSDSTCAATDAHAALAAARRLFASRRGGGVLGGDSRISLAF